MPISTLSIAGSRAHSSRFWKLRPIQLAITLAMVIVFSVVAVALVITGPLAQALGNVIGLGSTAVTVWNIAKWPVLLAIVVVMFSVLFHAAPNVKLPAFKWVSPGALLAVGLWIVASALFAFYVADFGSYDKTYGTLGGLVVLLVWMWITNSALLLGLEFNAERERSAQLAANVPRADREIQLEPRSRPKPKQST